MKATLEFYNDRDTSEVIAVNGHRIQYGGSDGDGFCYGHQSFDCITHLTPAERDAVLAVEYPEHL